MKILNKITNGILLIIIAILHTQFALSPDVFGPYFKEFSKNCFYQVSRGMDELPVVIGKTNFEAFAAFWFFYFGIILIPLGLLVHSIERKGKSLPHTFTISYLIVVAIGSYMVPSSGMTFIMLPHAVYMVIINIVRAKKQGVNN